MSKFNIHATERKKRYPEEYRRLAAKLRQIDRKDIWYIQYQLRLLYPEIPIPDRKTIGRWVDEYHGKEILAAQERLDALSQYGKVEFTPTRLVSKFLHRRRKVVTSALINSALETLITEHAIPDELYRKEDNDMLDEIAEEKQEQDITILNNKYECQ